MKFFKTLILILMISQVTFFFKARSDVLAASATPSSQNSTQSAKTPPQSKAQEILNRVADKVTEISNKMRRTYHGTVKSVSATSLTVSTKEGNRTISTNNATSFYRFRAGTRSEIELANIKAGDDISAMGTIDPQSEDMTAKQIIAKIHRYNYVGLIDSLEKGVATVTLNDNSQVKIDLTDALVLKKVIEGKIATAKLTDFNESSTIFVIAHSPDSKTGVYSSLKALVLAK